MRGVDIAVPRLDFEDGKKKPDAKPSQQALKKVEQNDPKKNGAAGPKKDASPADNKDVKKDAAPAGKKEPAPAEKKDEGMDAAPDDQGIGEAQEREYSEEKEHTEMEEAGQGEGYSGYGVEVVEYLEMEPVGDEARISRPPRHWGRWASAMFILAFVLGIIHAGAVLYYASGIMTPDELLGTAPCEVAGEVRDAAGRPIVNASVVVTDSSESTFTNADGWFVIRGISSGAHSIEASAEGYNAMSIRVDLRPNLLKSLDFTLEKGGDDVKLNEVAPLDFGQTRDSYLWSAPLFLVFSACALAAALLALRKKASRLTVLLGALAVPSFGFGLGSALAVIGALLAAAALRERPRPALKRLRVGMSYPSKKSCGDVEPAAMRRDEPESNDAAPSFGRSTSARTHEPLKPIPGPEDIEGAGERGTGKHGPQHLHGAAVHAKRYRRRSAKGHLTCCACVEEVELGAEYIRCVCGRNIHVRCLHQPACPDCGHPFGKWKEGRAPE